MELEILQRENIVSNKRMMTQSRNLFQTVITLEYNAYLNTITLCLDMNGKPIRIIYQSNPTNENYNVSRQHTNRNYWIASVSLSLIVYAIYIDR